MKLGGGRSELLLSPGWAPPHPRLHQVLEAPGVGLLRQEACSPGQWAGWAQGASRRCRRVGSAQLHFRQKLPQWAPPEWPGGEGRKHGVGSGSSFRNTLGSSSQWHGNERRRPTRRPTRTRTTRRRPRRRRRRPWPPSWQRQLWRWSWGLKRRRSGVGRRGLGSCSPGAGA